jgi:hypothetical protein
MTAHPGDSLDLSVPLEFEPVIPAQNSKFYSVDDAKRNRAEARIASKSLSVKNGICSICHDMLSDNHWRVSQSPVEPTKFLYHGSNAFAIAASTRAGCGVCKLLRQTLIERKLFGSVVDRSGQLYLHLEPWEEGGLRKCYLAWSIYARQPSLMTMEPLTLFAIPRSQPLPLGEEGSHEREDDEGDVQVNYPPILPGNNREALWLAKSWMDRCEASHELCRAQRKKYSTTPPTRLISVSGNAVKLYFSADIEGPVKYATLSHCWGNLQITTLERDNVSQFLVGIPEQALCKTFQHAIEITRSVDLQYLWIDSLCIIQDDPEDWTHEAARMSAVYGGSFFSIAAASATDGSQGCFFDRDPLYASHQPIDIPLDGRGSQKFMLANGRSFDRCVRNAALSTRAWVLQERLLAPRTVHFSSAEIFWECKEVNACESYPNGLPSFLDYTPDFDTQIDRLDKASLPLWESVVQLYSGCFLTFGKDKLPALMGIAEMFEEQIGDTYLAGMWRRELEHHLTWRIWHRPGANLPWLPRPNPPRAPSWSWAAIDFQILMPDFYRKADPQQISWYAPVADAQASVKDRAGTVWEGVLTLNCRTILYGSGVWNNGQTALWIGRDGSGNLPKIGRFDNGWSYGSPETCPQSLHAESRFDTVQDIGGVGQIPHPHYMLPICSGTTREGGRFAEGLIVKQTGQKHGEYQRIGAFTIEKDLWVTQLERLVEASESMQEDEYSTKMLSKAGIEQHVITII